MRGHVDIRSRSQALARKAATAPRGLKTQQHVAPRAGNNFNGVRLIAALLVLVGHAFVLDGSSVPRMLGVPLHSWGVNIFFCVSGYLIAGSRERGLSTPRFLWHRAIRIFPALWAFVIVTMLVIGPLASRLPMHTYFGSPDTWKYLTNLLLAADYTLPGVFSSDVHARGAINGSLWTLGLEFGCYLAVLAVGLLRSRALRSGLYVAGALGGAVLATQHGALTSPMILCVFFCSAAALRLLLSQPSWRMALTCAAVLTIVPSGYPQQVTQWIALPILVVWFGSHNTPVFRDAAIAGDLSYGVYLWGYTVQQLTLDVFGRLPVSVSIALVVPLTFACALGSWWLIERPALRLKSWRQPPSGNSSLAVQ